MIFNIYQFPFFLKTAVLLTLAQENERFCKWFLTSTPPKKTNNIRALFGHSSGTILELFGHYSGTSGSIRAIGLRKAMVIFMAAAVRGIAKATATAADQVLGCRCCPCGRAAKLATSRPSTRRPGGPRPWAWPWHGLAMPWLGYSFGGPKR